MRYRASWMGDWVIVRKEYKYEYPSQKGSDNRGLHAVIQNFNSTCRNQIEESSTKVTQAYSRVKVEGFATLPAPQSMENWLCPERNGRDTQS